MAHFKIMRWRLAIIGLLALIFINSCKQNEYMSDNPLFPALNQAVVFSQVTSEHIALAADSVIDITRKDLEMVYSLPKDSRTFNNTMRATDELMHRLNTITSYIYLLTYVHPDSSIRDEGQKAITKLSKYGNELSMDEQLYQAMLDFSSLPEAEKLDAAERKFLDENLRDFERNGLALPEDKKARLKEIKDRVSEISINFGANIAAHQDELIVDELGIEGLPEDYKAQRVTSEGKYRIDLSYPSYVPFMRYATSSDARKELYMKYMNRAVEKNLLLLDELIVQRNKMAEVLGYPTYAAWAIENRMAKTTNTVWAFEKNLVEKVKQKALLDYTELLEAREVPGADTVIMPWESAHFNNNLLMKKYQLDNELVKQYFEMNNVIEGLFTISSKLFGVKFNEVENPNVWQEDVKMYEVVSGRKTVGRFYLDLHPRPNKYNHAACFTLSRGRITPSGQEIPVASLVCNFPKATAETPSLILHNDVVTFFHEFGHLMHALLSNPGLSAQAGISNARDFVEVPSQFLENWAWNHDALKLFATHYQTGEVLPSDLYAKMLAAKNVGSGIHTLQQLFYGMLDMTFHDGFDPAAKSTTDVVRELQNEITLFPYVEGTSFHASFGHLTGYAAGYYSYLWALVYAEDIFSEFTREGILNEQLGKRFRELILEKGSSVDELEMVRDFLGREPNDEAFIRSLGL
jgi:thimet oligopeptidase